MEIEICTFDTGRNPVSQAQGNSLKPVELKILGLQKNGMSEGEIADELGLSVGEVSKRLKAIERKVILQRDAAEYRRDDRGPD